MALGIVEQAHRAVVNLAQLEQRRQMQLRQGDRAGAMATLDRMANTFAAAPSTVELKGVVRNRMINGQNQSGLDYHTRRLNGLGASYNNGSMSDTALRERIQRSLLNLRGLETVVPAQLAPYARPGVQAASYHYATRVQSVVGSGLGAIMASSVADDGRRMADAEDRSIYLDWVVRNQAIFTATLAGLGRSDWADGSNATANWSSGGGDSSSGSSSNDPFSDICNTPYGFFAEECSDYYGKGGPTDPKYWQFKDAASWMAAMYRVGSTSLPTPNSVARGLVARLSNEVSQWGAYGPNTDNAQKLKEKTSDALKELYRRNAADWESDVKFLWVGTNAGWVSYFTSSNMFCPVPGKQDGNVCAIRRELAVAAFLRQVWSELPNNFTSSPGVKEGFIDVAYWNSRADQLVDFPLTEAGAIITANPDDPSAAQDWSYTDNGSAGGGSGAKSGSGDADKSGSGGAGESAEGPNWMLIGGGVAALAVVGFLLMRKK